MRRLCRNLEVEKRQHKRSISRVFETRTRVDGRIWICVFKRCLPTTVNLASYRPTADQPADDSIADHPANTPTGHQRADHFVLLLGLERLRDVHGRRQLRR